MSSDKQWPLKTNSRPSLFSHVPAISGTAKGHEPAKHQAVLALDMQQWEELIDLFDIKEPMIRHREEEDHSTVGKKGWYA